jgi:uncharacterized LabA/DUF88 family protein
MTLRFFGRQRIDESKTGSAMKEENLSTGTGAPQRSRTSGAARRAARARRARSEQVAKVAPSRPPESTPKAEAPSRGRRRRRPAAREGGETAAVPEVPSPPAVDLSGLQEVLAQQGSLLEGFASKQLTALRSVQRSLSAIEKQVAVPQHVEASLPRLGIFVDVPNVMYAAERRRIAIDFGLLRDFLSRGRELVRASAYAPISDDPQAKLETQKFVQPFVGKEYRIVTKPLKRYGDGTMKANFDVELAIDILTMCDRLDVVSLVSGDGDFRRLVELVASRGVRVQVVAFAESMSGDLRALADECVEIGEHLKELQAK